MKEISFNLETHTTKVPSKNDLPKQKHRGNQTKSKTKQ